MSPSLVTVYLAFLSAAPGASAHPLAIGLSEQDAAESAATYIREEAAREDAAGLDIEDRAFTGDERVTVSPVTSTPAGLRVLLSTAGVDFRADLLALGVG